MFMSAIRRKLLPIGRSQSSDPCPSGPADGFCQAEDDHQRGSEGRATPTEK